MDAAGNLYGTASMGGKYVFFGIVFELVPTANGTWKEKILHTFNREGAEGIYPYGNLIFDAKGNLYGTTAFGGTYGYGTVFELMPTESGGWKEKILHVFQGSDGYFPYGGLTFDSEGNLYGTTVFGAAPTCDAGFGCGVVFELSPGAKGKWTESVVAAFDGDNGANPYANLTLDASGNLYGTTAQGGDLSCNDGAGCGIAFKLIPKGNGSWAEKVLHVFKENRKGSSPQGTFALDASGNLYNTAYQGGELTCYYDEYGCGIVFELEKSGTRTTEKIIYAFDYDGHDGSGPTAGIIFDASGNMYGTASRGGKGCGADANGCGTVFEITPD